MTTKQCYRCKNILDTSFFTKDLSKKDGFRSSCKNCKEKKQYFCEKDGKKECMTCKTIKQLSEFFPNKKSSLGKVSSDCKECFYKNVVTKPRKICGRCKEEKDSTLFSKYKRSLDGLSYVCKECKSNATKEINYKRLENIVKTCSSCNIEKISSEFYSDKKRKDGLCTICSECTKIKTRNWAQENKEIANKTIRDRKKKEPLFRLGCNLRSTIKDSFKRACKGAYKKSDNTESILGCTMQEFILHLQSLFTEGMTLENHGNCEDCWHIDHKIPISSAKTEDEIVKLNHYTNLQPLWRSDNLSKGKKLI